MGPLWMQRVDKLVGSLFAPNLPTYLPRQGNNLRAPDAMMRCVRERERERERARRAMNIVFFFSALIAKRHLQSNNLDSKRREKSVTVYTLILLFHL